VQGSRQTPSTNNSERGSSLSGCHPKSSNDGCRTLKNARNSGYANLNAATGHSKIRNKSRHPYISPIPKKPLPFLFHLCSNAPMTHHLPQFTSEDIPEIPFTPVPLGRVRHNGWSEGRQRQFVSALAVMGSVRHAAKAVGMGRASAYRLRERAGAESFASAWDAALEEGRTRMFTCALDRAINGVTTVRVLRGGSVSLIGGPDMQLVRAALRDDSPPAKATQETDLP
jgi:hypothetical protein